MSCRFGSCEIYALQVLAVGCSVEEVREVVLRVLVPVVVIPFDGRLLDGPVHLLNLAVAPRAVRFGQAMLDPICLPGHVEAHWPKTVLPVPRLLCEP